MEFSCVRYTIKSVDRRTFLTLAAAAPALAAPRRTTVTIRGEQFLLNGKPTYAGRSYRGMKIEGLLMNVRAVQGIFDTSLRTPADGVLFAVVAAIALHERREVPRQHRRQHSDQP